MNYEREEYLVFETKRNYGTRWTTKSTYVDIQSGEELTKHRAKTEYIIINKTKRTIINGNKTRGCIEVTNECIRQQQGKLF